MGIKHSSTATHGSKGLATQWNDDHVIDGDVDASNHKIKNLAAPTANNDAARLTDILSPPGTVPIGGVLAWLKSYTNTPALPVNFVECNGQVLADIASVYNGQTIPNLNSDNRFLRGNTISGAVGGEDTHVLIVAEMPSHKHSIPCRPGSGYTTSLTNQSTTANTTKDSNYTGGDGAHNNLPKYYEVVWIMRIK